MYLETSIVCPSDISILSNKIEKTALSIASQNNKIFVDKNNKDINFNEENVNFKDIIKIIKDNLTSDAFIICSFEDYGVEEARKLKSKLVLGVGEASFITANLISDNFSIITTLSSSHESIRNNLKKYGLYEKCVSLQSIEVPVLDLETMSNQNLRKLKNEVYRTITEESPGSIIITNPAIINIKKKLEDEFKIPIIEGVSATVAFTEMLFKLGFNMNKKMYNNFSSTNYNGYFSQYLKF